ncbi:hypothetical protein H0I23_12565 [Cellulophaga sp. HaHaR_3_176]|uniref:hypothetical protein n=1 Tax=Cellulophaga sp. HaHaR_3_176 TaxID=1942464 RepID=UPI001C1FA10B|nr:hypothetical protein [Cellulophaga sp. HaHaR_3_176]QWX83279.1 hypothetical protein H0I23_12565 [Cellulophaga sp. HaHaR_3_176]
MKNLVYATAIAIGSLGSMNAAIPAPIFHDGIMEEIFAQDFSEIKIEALPEAITAAFEKDFPGATIKKAHVNGEAEYKLEVSVEGGEGLELYADGEGNWLDM